MTPPDMGSPFEETNTPIESIDLVLDVSVFGQLFLIGVALTLISSLVGAIFVMRYEPLKILANRT